MDVGAILSKSLTLYRRNLILILPHLIVFAIDLIIFIAFALFTALILLLILGSLTITSAMSLLEGPTPFLLIGYLIFGIMTILILGVLLGAYARAAVIGMVIEAKKEGKTSLRTGFESAKKHGVRIFGYVIAITVVPALAIMVVGFIIMLVSVFILSLVEMTSGIDLVFAALVLFVFLLFTVAFIVIYVIAMFSPQKIVIENLGVIDGIKASFGFVKKYSTGVVIYIGVAFAVMVATSLVSIMFSMPRIIFTNIDQFIAMFFFILENLVSFALGLMVTPYLEAVKTLMVLQDGGEKSEVESPPVL